MELREQGAELRRVLKAVQEQVLAAGPHEHASVRDALAVVAALVFNCATAELPFGAAFKDVPWAKASNKEDNEQLLLWRESFLCTGYLGFTHFLLRVVCPNWLPSFSASERREFIDVFFLSPCVPRLQAILALCSVLEPRAAPRQSAATSGCVFLQRPITKSLTFYSCYFNSSLVSLLSTVPTAAQPPHWVRSPPKHAQGRFLAFCSACSSETSIDAP
jgi:hypothetical protein